MNISREVVIIFALLYSFMLGCSSIELTSGRLYLKNEQYEEAIVQLERATSKNAKDVEAWYNLGYAYYQVGNYSLMNKAFHECSNISDKYAGEIKKYPIENWVLGRFVKENDPPVKKTSPLFQICIDGDWHKADSLLRSTTDLEIKDADGRTALILASQYGNTETVRVLLDRGANPNATDNDGRTSLHYAAQNNFYEISLMLLKNANVNAVDADGSSPLHLACMGYNNLSVVNLLLEKKANINIRSNEGWTPLMYACNYASANIVKILLNSGAKINDRNKNGWSPLLIAVTQLIDDSTRNVVPLLYEKGFDVLPKNKLSALHFAAANLNGTAVRALIQLDSVVDKKNDAGFTPLMWAADTGSIEILRILLDKGAKINEKTIDGTTPLMYAVNERTNGVVDYLIQRGANVNVKNFNGLTALLKACYIGNDDVAVVLIANGADVEVNYSGWTPLMYASAKGLNGTAEKILRKLNNNKQILQKTEKGTSALDIALSYKEFLIVKRMMELFPELNSKKESFQQYGKGIQYQALLDKQKYLPLYSQAKLDSLLRHYKRMEYEKYRSIYAELGIALYPKNIFYYREASAAYYALQMYAKYGNYLLSGSLSDSSSSESKYAKAEYLFSKNENADALNLLIQSIDMAPKDSTKYFSLFNVLSIDSTAIGLQYSTLMIKYFPSISLGYLAKATCYEKMQNTAAAVELLRSVPAAIDDETRVNHRLAYYLFKQKDYSSAKQVIEKIIKKDTTDTGVYALLGNIYFNENNYSAAVENFTKYDIEYDDRFILAQCYNKLGETLRAKEILSSVYYWDNKSSPGLMKMITKGSDTLLVKKNYELGVIESEMGNRDKALQYFNDALEGDPKYAAAYFYIAKNYSHVLPKEQFLPYCQKAAEFGDRDARIWMENNKK